MCLHGRNIKKTSRHTAACVHLHAALHLPLERYAVGGNPSSQADAEGATDLRVAVDTAACESSIRKHRKHAAAYAA